ncbi:MAG: tripartite tricarboxylate transporter substrate binding protein [Desulfovibrionaceae bacterium]|nr:tripartite tricarboxylate transporter substrate binding protein [Desulfovibrionaceae bacterium]
MKRFIMIALTVCSLMLLPAAQHATAAFPEKPVELMVIFPAGGPTDLDIRILAKYTEKYLGQKLVIINVPGGGGIVGWNTVPDKPKDGYFLCNINTPHILSFPLLSDTRFDYNTFEPLIMVSQDPTLFMVRNDSPYKTFKELVDAAKAKPGSITVGTAGLNLAHHIAAVQVEQELGVKFSIIPFQGSSGSMSALLGNQIDLLSDTLSDYVTKLEGQVRILAVGMDKRTDFAPNAPTFKEVGVQGYIPSSDRGVAVPAGTNPAVKKILAEAFMKAANDPEYQAEAKKAGLLINILAPEMAVESFKKELVTLKALLDKAGMKKK